MRRLKHILLKMNLATTTFKELYEGAMYIKPLEDNKDSYYEYDSRYFDGPVSYCFTQTNKLAQSKPTVDICIPTYLLGIEGREMTTASADYCLRSFIPYIDKLNVPLFNKNRPDDEKGKYYIFNPDSKVIVRNASYFKKINPRYYRYGSGLAVTEDNEMCKRPPLDCLCIKIQIQFPQKNLKKVMFMLLEDLPNSVADYINDFDLDRMRLADELYRMQNDMRRELQRSQYCAFIANGSLLPREGDSDLPKKNAVTFVSPKEDEIELCGIRGMGIKRGVTVITGGGYSGKSTLLKAIMAGSINRIAGDGRELCITDRDAMEIMAEDGRSVKNVNISPFIKWIPGEDTRHFYTDRASGSTSQAANICEALSYGTRLLLIDEDKSATNFMIRDKLMRKLIPNEPITPFTDRVNELYANKGVSTILVIGGSSEYLAVADRIYLMDAFKVRSVDSNELQLSFAPNEEDKKADWEQVRRYKARGFTAYPKGATTEKLAINELGVIYLGDEIIDTSCISGIQSPSQQTAVAFILRALCNMEKQPIFDASRRLDTIYMNIMNEGMDQVFSQYFTSVERFLELPRKIDVLATINRMRYINIE